MSSIDVIPERPGSKYTREQIREAAAHYVVLGNASRVEAITGIPNETISGWKCQTEWWDQLIAKVREEKQDEIDATYTRAIHAAAEAAIDRIQNGDTKLLKVNKIVDGEVTQDYEERRVPISGKDAIMISAIAFDKRQIIRNLPTSISASNSDELKKLREQFASLSGKVVEGEVIEDK